MSAEQPPQPGTPGGSETSMGLEPQLLGLLCYAFSWVSGLIIFLMEKRNAEIRFHAAQSILLGAFVSVVAIVVPNLFYLFSFTTGAMVSSLIGMAAFALWIFTMIKGYQLDHFKFPVAGDIAENMAKN